MNVTVDLGPLTDPELGSWITAFTVAARRAATPDLHDALDTLREAGAVEASRRRQGGAGSRRQTIRLADPDADPSRTDAVRDDLIYRLQAHRDAPWIGPRFSEALHTLLLDLADDRARVRRESESVRDLIASRFFRGSVPVTGND